ncbi:MAG: hypothetical protein HOP19_20675 [Acidobacteria bacterium]|nr:hypothetical protein [Acidobacteriota bacterium]
MIYSAISRIFTIRFALTVTFFYLLGSVSLLAFAQAHNTSTINGGTSPGNAPGAPAGSYKLSDFERINLYNGHLSLSFPLLQVAGRGTAGYSPMLNINPWAWTVSSQYQSHGVDLLGNPSNYFWDHYATAGWLPGLRTGYGPGVMQVRQSGTNPHLENGSYVYSFSLSVLTFSASDGTEFEFIDKNSNGQLQACYSYDRGSVWQTKDGSAATFELTDSDANDNATMSTSIGDECQVSNAGVWSVTGNLRMKDGTWYRIVGGLVKWIQDRNGNRTTFTYDSNKRITQAKDSLNRLVTFAYSVNEGGQFGVCDVITYQGFANTERKIRIARRQLGTLLSSGAVKETGGSQGLFDQLALGTTYNPGDFVSKLWMPDGRFYQFFYNAYGEITRVILPTNGKIEYAHDKGLSTSPNGGAIGDYNMTQGVDPHVGIYRRLRERKVFKNDTDTTPESLTDYGLPVHDQTNIVDKKQTVVVKITNPSGTTPTLPISASKHYFREFAYESILYPSNGALSNWFDGKECQTDILNSSLQMLRSAVNNWVDSPAPAGPRLMDVTASLENGLVSKQHFEYDGYNNQTEVKEYDYGTGSPGTLIRRTRTDYLTNGYDTIGSGNLNATIHIRNLPTTQQTYDAKGTEATGDDVLMTQTSFEYDVYDTSAGHAALMGYSNVSGHASNPPVTNPATMPTYTASDLVHMKRGNLTAVMRHLLGNNPGSVKTCAQYDITGNVVKAIDAIGNATQFDFRDNFGAPADSTIRSGDTPANNPPSQLGGTMFAYAFPFKVTNALNQTVYSKYDFYLARPVLAEDLNGIKSNRVCPTKLIHRKLSFLVFFVFRVYL